MSLSKVLLQNFRSYRQKEFKFSSGLSLVVGKNTSGKTNLLEAIALLATGKSFRAGVEREMIGYGKEIARIQAVIVSSGSSSDNGQKVKGAEGKKLEIVLTPGQVNGERAPKKKYLVNGVSKRRMDFLGNLRCVLFRPEDLEIIIDSPSVRRNYLDDVLEPVDQEYRRMSLSYLKGLRQRNRLLEQIREEGKPRSVLYFWDKLLIENGGMITRKREEYLNFINQYLVTLGILGGLRLGYKQSLVTAERLKKYAREEVAAGMTLVGPHRDDLFFEIHDAKRKKSRDLSIYGSRGEQRLAVFSLKLAELEFVTRRIGVRPILLLDDIFSELDHDHRSRVLKLIPKQQTIITATDPHLIPKTYLEKAIRIRL